MFTIGSRETGAGNGEFGTGSREIYLKHPPAMCWPGLMPNNDPTDKAVRKTYG